MLCTSFLTHLKDQNSHDKLSSSRSYSSMCYPSIANSELYLSFHQRHNNSDRNLSCFPHFNRIHIIRPDSFSWDEMNSSVSKVRYYKGQPARQVLQPIGDTFSQTGMLSSVYCFNCSGKPFKRVYLETFLKMLFPIFLGKQHLPKRNFICGDASLSSRDRKIWA